MNVLLVGSGGREHALAWALAASPLVSKLYCAPGNAGIAEAAECIPIGVTELDRLVAFAREKNIAFAVIGPEVPLVEGLWDQLEAAGVRALGPSKRASVLEASKGFVKDLCAAHKIPTARYHRFREKGAAKAFAEELGFPVVIKEDGLAAGKGVVISESKAQTARAIDMMLDGANAEIVVEEFLDGEEASFFVLSDGENILPLASAQDHKRVYDGDKGPNTGGMGAYSPAPVMTPEVTRKTIDKIIKPTIAAMAARGTPYMGVLFAGLMIKDGEPKLIEYNCRFGDPECQVLMMRLKSDLLTALTATRDKQLKHIDLRWSDDAALTVVMATKGYPGDYAKGSEIRGLDNAARVEGVKIFHAGTALKDGKLVATGGRVLNVTATGKTVSEAQARAYKAVDQIDWPSGFCRRDIGWRAVAREKEEA
ncbi:MAG TPA: phosphoribosylamine--glycine ligase [Rhizomicrobium sp.]|jgi:phosphoribosylamine--glycine ligase|nr:phosphoribosylamine--glycine ligase [Rhizomicrobium sp.]